MSVLIQRLRLEGKRAGDAKVAVYAGAQIIERLHRIQSGQVFVHAAAMGRPGSCLKHFLATVFHRHSENCHLILLLIFLARFFLGYCLYADLVHYEME